MSKEPPISITLDINKRWEDGTPHHPKSLELFKHLADIDFKYCDDYFCWKSGGDGDNGETLMYEMDSYFETLDKTRNPSDSSITPELDYICCTLADIAFSDDLDLIGAKNLAKHAYKELKKIAPYLRNPGASGVAETMPVSLAACAEALEYDVDWHGRPHTAIECAKVVLEAAGVKYHD